MPDVQHVDLPVWAWTALRVLLIVVVALVLLRLTRGFVHGIFKRLLDREATEGTAQDLGAVELRKRLDTLDGLGASVIQGLIVVIAGLMILGELGVNIGPAVAGLGIVGIAVGFGSQSLVKDYFNGSLILIENQYGKGDVVRIAGVEGTVEDVSLRRTTLRDFDGNVHTVPNSAIVVASNLTRGWARINEELQVPTADDVEIASDIVNRVGREMAADPAWRRWLLEAPHVERIDAIGPGGVTLKIGGRVAAGHRWTAVGEIRRRLLLAFREAGLPFVPGRSATAVATGSGAAATPPPPPPASAALDTTTPPAPDAGQDTGGPTDRGSSAAPGQDDLAQGTE